MIFKKKTMNYNNLKLVGISHDVKYIFTNEGILETNSFFSDSKTNLIEYSFNNLHLGIKMLKEHYSTFYKANQISLIEYSNSPRKSLYRLLEIFELKNYTTIIKEWEKVYGNKLLLINESVDKLLVESRINDAWNSVSNILHENIFGGFLNDPLGSIGKGVKNVGNWAYDQGKKAVDWTSDQAKQIRDKGFFTWAGEKVNSAWKYVKDSVAKAWKCLTNNFFECLMEGIRYASFSAVGMGVMTAISFIPGVGQVADVVVFGSLLIWDIYKMLSGKYESGKYKWSWFEIIIDAICAVLPALGFLAKSAFRGIKGFAELGVKAATEGGIFKTVLNFFKGSLGKVFSTIGKSMKFVGEKLGLEFLVKYGSKAETILTKGVETSEKAALASTKEGKKSIVGTARDSLKKAGQGIKQFTKDFKFTKPLPVVLKKSGKTVMITAALCAALGVDGWTCQHKIENGEISEEEIKKAEEKLKFGLQSKEIKKEMDKMSVDDAEKQGLF
jgi:hypothetical protein